MITSLTTDEILNKHEQMMLDPELPEFKDYCHVRWVRIIDVKDQLWNTLIKINGASTKNQEFMNSFFGSAEEQDSGKVVTKIHCDDSSVSFAPNAKRDKAAIKSDDSCCIRMTDGKQTKDALNAQDKTDNSCLAHNQKESGITIVDVKVIDDKLVEELMKDPLCKCGHERSCHFMSHFECDMRCSCESFKSRGVGLK